MIVFAADEAGLKWLTERLPKDDRFPLKLMHHAAFHSPLLNHVVPMARARILLAISGLVKFRRLTGRAGFGRPARSAVRPFMTTHSARN